MIRLYNSYSQRIEDFKTLEPQKVRMYVCGITPYDTTHVGHAFTYVQFDALVRFLTYSGYAVDYTQNVTDIDDDILKRAKEEGREWKELGDFWTNQYLRDMKALNVKMPTHFVRATDSIPTILTITQKLVEDGFAYEKDQTVYFDVSTYSSYGSLSHFSQSQMLLLSKERGANPNDPNKKNPLDFILWQKSKENEPSWESPWGKGRPGWHIECSSMIYDTLGQQIDIHGGGRDLLFPHHESERAQSESFTKKTPFVATWMHTAMVEYQGEKMSKSLGNMIMVYDLLKSYSPNAIRMYLLSHHYRKPWEFSEEEVTHYEELNKKIGSIEKQGPDLKIPPEFSSALQNDFDTPTALSVFEKAIDSSSDSVGIMSSVLGLA